jgi:hypothetical protein
MIHWFEILRRVSVARVSGYDAGVVLLESKSRLSSPTLRAVLVRCGPGATRRDLELIESGSATSRLIHLGNIL